MKSTYKLIGTFLDGLPESHLSESFLFDTKANATHISLKTLLQMQSEADLLKELKMENSIGNLIIDIDYCLAINNPIQKAFLEKRFNQTVYYLSNIFEHIEIVRKLSVE